MQDTRRAAQQAILQCEKRAPDQSRRPFACLKSNDKAYIFLAEQVEVAASHTPASLHAIRFGLCRFHVAREGWPGEAKGYG
jgi:hypothetical protein